MFYKKGEKNLYFVKVVKYYRAMGYFYNYKSLNDEELRDKIEMFIKEQYGLYVTDLCEKKKYRKYLNIAILSFDAGRAINEEYIRDISDKNVKWRFFHLILILLTTLDFVYVFYKLTNILGSVFNGNNRASLNLFISVVFGSIFGGYTSKFLIHSLLGDKVKEYNLYLTLFYLNNPIRSKNIKYLSAFTLLISFIFLMIKLN